MKRFQELDGLRGLAATTVLLAHTITVGKLNYSHSLIWKIINYSPLRVFFGGYPPVILFFVLSGFVLALPFLDVQRDNRYVAFIVKRICRIYIPYLIAIILAVIIRCLFHWNTVRGFDVVNISWTAPITLKLVLQHILMIDSFNNEAFDPVIWSLTQEMRISIVFPLIMFIVLRYNWRISVLLGGLVSFVGIFGNYFFNHYTNLPNDYMTTLEFSYMFIIGATVAKHRSKLTCIWENVTPRKKVLLIICAFICYVYGYGIPFFRSWITMAGTVVFLIWALCSSSFQGVLTVKPVRFLGKISYSMYLFHILVLFSLSNILFGVIPFWVIWFISLPLMLMVSVLMWYIVEAPSTRLGKRLFTNLEPRRKMTTLNTGKSV